MAKATRPVFKSILNDINFVDTINLEFEWFPGFDISQKQKSIRSLHEKAKTTNKLKRILEISSKSQEEIGINASAFNLKLRTAKGFEASVESFYQGSKIFENGGPFVDLYQKSSRESKKDQRLKTSGDLKGFLFEGEEWGINEHFYDWLYLNALSQNKEISEKIIQYDAFTDIEFNPKKSFNCQAYTAALYKAITTRNINLNEIKNPKKFKEIFPKDELSNFQLQLF